MPFLALTLFKHRRGLPPAKHTQYSLHASESDAVCAIARFLEDGRFDLKRLGAMLQDGGVYWECARDLASYSYVLHIPKDADLLQTALDFAVGVDTAATGDAEEALVEDCVP